MWCQKGQTKYYRGVKMDMTLLPKVKVEVVVSKVPVATVVKAAKKALYTGSIGDGKIFVYGVENVIKGSYRRRRLRCFAGRKLNHFLTYKERRSVCYVQTAFCYKVSPDTR